MVKRGFFAIFIFWISLLFSKYIDVSPYFPSPRIEDNASRLGILIDGIYLEDAYPIATLLGKFNIPTMFLIWEEDHFLNFGPSGKKLEKEYNAIVVPSYSLHYYYSNTFLKEKLRKYIASGGTVILFAPLYGRDVEFIFDSLDIIGAREDFTSFAGKAFPMIYHPMFASSGRRPLNIHINGFIYSFPSNSQILMLREDDLVCAILYPMGKGRVIITTFTSDRAYKEGNLTEEEAEIIRDLILWAMSPKESFKTFELGNKKINIPLTIVNRFYWASIEIKEKREVMIYYPNGKEVFYKRKITLPKLDIDEGFKYELKNVPCPKVPGVYPIYLYSPEVKGVFKKEVFLGSFAIKEKFRQKRKIDLYIIKKELEKLEAVLKNRVKKDFKGKLILKVINGINTEELFMRDLYIPSFISKKFIFPLKRKENKVIFKVLEKNSPIPLIYKIYNFKYEDLKLKFLTSIKPAIAVKGKDSVEVKIEVKANKETEGKLTVFIQEIHKKIFDRRVKIYAGETYRTSIKISRYSLPTPANYTLKVCYIDSIQGKKFEKFTLFCVRKPEYKIYVKWPHYLSTLEGTKLKIFVNREDEKIYKGEIVLRISKSGSKDTIWEIKYRDVSLPSSDSLLIEIPPLSYEVPDSVNSVKCYVLTLIFKNEKGKVVENVSKIYEGKFKIKFVPEIKKIVKGDTFTLRLLGENIGSIEYDLKGICYIPDTRFKFLISFILTPGKKRYVEMKGSLREHGIFHPVFEVEKCFRITSVLLKEYEWKGMVKETEANILVYKKEFNFPERKIPLFYSVVNKVNSVSFCNLTIIAGVEDEEEGFIELKKINRGIVISPKAKFHGMEILDLYPGEYLVKFRLFSGNSRRALDSLNIKLKISPKKAIFIEKPSILARHDSLLIFFKIKNLSVFGLKGKFYIKFPFLYKEKNITLNGLEERKIVLKIPNLIYEGSYLMDYGVKEGGISVYFSQDIMKVYPKYKLKVNNVYCKVGREIYIPFELQNIGTSIGEDTLSLTWKGGVSYKKIYDLKPGERVRDSICLKIPFHIRKDKEYLLWKIKECKYVSILNVGRYDIIPEVQFDKKYYEKGDTLNCRVRIKNLSNKGFRGELKMILNGEVYKDIINIGGGQNVCFLKGKLILSPFKGLIFRKGVYITPPFPLSGVDSLKIKPHYFKLPFTQVLIFARFFSQEGVSDWVEIKKNIPVTMEQDYIQFKIILKSVFPILTPIFNKLSAKLFRKGMVEDRIFSLPSLSWTSEFYFVIRNRGWQRFKCEIVDLRGNVIVLKDNDFFVRKKYFSLWTEKIQYTPGENIVAHVNPVTEGKFIFNVYPFYKGVFFLSRKPLKFSFFLPYQMISNRIYCGYNFIKGKEEEKGIFVINIKEKIFNVDLQDVFLNKQIFFPGEPFKFNIKVECEMNFPDYLQVKGEIKRRDTVLKRVEGKVKLSDGLNFLSISGKMPNFKKRGLAYFNYDITYEYTSEKLNNKSFHVRVERGKIPFSIAIKDRVKPFVELVYLSPSFYDQKTGLISKFKVRDESPVRGFLKYLTPEGWKKVEGIINEDSIFTFEIPDFKTRHSYLVYGEFIDTANNKTRFPEKGYIVRKVATTPYFREFKIDKEENKNILRWKLSPIVISYLKRGKRNFLLPLFKDEKYAILIFPPFNKSILKRISLMVKAWRKSSILMITLFSIDENWLPGEPISESFMIEVKRKRIGGWRRIEFPDIPLPDKGCFIVFSSPTGGIGLYSSREENYYTYRRRGPYGWHLLKDCMLLCRVETEVIPEEKEGVERMLSHFNIYRQDISNLYEFPKIAETKDFSFTDTTMEVGKVYRYHIEAVFKNPDNRVFSPPIVDSVRKGD